MAAGERGRVILPFADFVLVRNGIISEDQRELDSSTTVHSIGFLMAERKVKFCHFSRSQI
jgi:hypothetical protein